MDEDKCDLVDLSDSADLSLGDDLATNQFKLYPDRKKHVKALNTRVTLGLAILALFVPVYVFQSWSLFSVVTNSHLRDYMLFSYVVLAIFTATALPMTYFYVRRKFDKTVQPILDFREDGLEIHSLNFDILIPWSEIKEARTVTFIEPHLAIVPHDFRKTVARGSLRTRAIAHANNLIAPLYEIFGMYVPRIFVLQSQLPMSVHDLAELINVRLKRAPDGLPKLTAQSSMRKSEDQS